MKKLTFLTEVINKNQLSIHFYKKNLSLFSLNKILKKFKMI